MWGKIKLLNASTFLMAAFALLFVATQIGCTKIEQVMNDGLGTLARPSTEDPVPKTAIVHKSMFYKSGRSGEFTLEGATPRTFACGWAPQTENGDYTGLHNYNYAGHCNLQWKVNEFEVTGLLVNPSYPNDPTRWVPAIRIPVVQHFYIEKDKDARGRETNTVIYNASRSDWKARPYVELDLLGTQIMSAVGFMQYYSNQNFSNMFFCDAFRHDAYDVEVDERKGWLAFTLNGSDACLVSDSNMHVRFNFLAFESQGESFEQRRYHDWNSRHFNVLHILGKRPNGVDLAKYAARWDFGTPQKPKTIDLYLNQFPKEYAPLGVEIVNLWNDMLSDVLNPRGFKNHRPFKPIIKDLKYAFDLRYPAITWVADKRMSMGAPLGVGMTLADVTNGEILWGGVTVWAGMINNYLNHYQTSLGAAGMQTALLATPSAEGLNTDLLYGEDQMARVAANARSRFSQQFPAYGHAPRAKVLRDYFAEKSNSFSDFLAANEAARVYRPEYKAQAGHAEAFMTYLSDLSSQDGSKGSDISFDQMKKIAQSYIQDNQAIDKNTELISVVTSVRESGIRNEILSQMTPATTQSNLRDTKASSHEVYLKKYAEQHGMKLEQLGLPSRLDESSMEELITQAQVANSGAVMDLDRTLADVALGYGESTSSRSGPDWKQAFYAVMKDLLLHEMGHMIGLGHNFKENIIPEKGTVPESVRKTLADQNNDEHGYTQMTTVMGYRSGFTEAITPPEHLKPGPHDRLVLHYLYAGKVALYTYGDTSAKDHRFVDMEDVAPDGRLARYVPLERRIQGQEYVSYYPACNDYFASTASDPYCQRWDRGGDSVSLVKNHFRELKTGLFSKLFNPLGLGGNHYRMESYLYSRTMRELSRVRLFYDYMRQKYADVIATEIASGPTAEENLYQFSVACRDDGEHPKLEGEELEEYRKRVSKSSRQLKDVFKRNPELKQLCVANGIALKEYENLLKTPGKDYARLDYNEYHRTSAMIGGDLYWYDTITGQEIGVWERLGIWPIRTAVLTALTSPYAYNVWWYWAYPVWKYSRPDGLYVYNTLYPYEFNTSVASAVDSGIFKTNLEKRESATIAASLTSLGWRLLWMNYISGDKKKFPGLSDYFDRLEKQTEFSFRWAAVVVNKVPMLKDPDRTKTLEASLFNFDTYKWETIHEAYLTPERQVIARPQAETFLLPVTQFKMFSESSGYYMAFKLTYDELYDDVLKGTSVKSKLVDLYSEAINNCIVGPNGAHGLREFFTMGTEFQGFNWSDEAYKPGNAKNSFNDSVRTAYNQYYATFSGAKPEVCQEALKMMGLVVGTAASLNGYWLNMGDYVEWGNP